MARSFDGPRDWFTKLWIRFYRGSFLSVERFDKDEPSSEVYWFDGDGTTLGQATLVGTIILNKPVLEELSDQAAELVYRHERGHFGRHPVFRGLFVLAFILGVLGPYYFLKSLAFWVLVPFGFPVTPVALLTGAAVVMMVTFLVAFWFEELAADLHALRTLGEDAFLTGYDEIRSGGGSNLWGRIQVTLLYPSAKTVVKVNRFLEE